jgi:branched-chain amino acid aminotransferase
MAGYDDRDGKIWMDGKLVDWRDANVHILTHAMHYASSVFEGERAYGGKIFKSPRTFRTAAFLRRANCWTSRSPGHVDEIEAAKQEVLTANGLSDAYVRAVAWRGAGEDMGVASARNPVRWPSPPGNGAITTATPSSRAPSSTSRNGSARAPRPSRCHAKAAGLYMICTMSKHAAEAKGCSDALFFDYRGYVAEATGANIFFVKDGEVHTPKPGRAPQRPHPADRDRHAEERQIKVHERHIMPEEMEGFEQCWLTGSAAEVTPVGEIGPYSFEVGALTREIAEAYEALVRS